MGGAAKALWPLPGEEEHRREADALLACPEAAVFLARADRRGAAIGFAEATLRRDYVNGCETSPVAFLEGIFVAPGHRRRGAARSLCEAVERWAWERGCSEFASDAELGNTGSHAMHEALGFEETERVVYYRKRLTSPLVQALKGRRSLETPPSPRGPVSRGFDQRADRHRLARRASSDRARVQPRNPAAS